MELVIDFWSDDVTTAAANGVAFAIIGVVVTEGVGFYGVDIAELFEPCIPYQPRASTPNIMITA